MLSDAFAFIYGYVKIAKAIGEEDVSNMGLYWALYMVLLCDV